MIEPLFPFTFFYCGKIVMLKKNANKVTTILKTSGNLSSFRLSGVQRLIEFSLILSILIAVFSSVALLTFSPSDPSWSQTAWADEINNGAGAAGAWFADSLFFIFGLIAYFFPFGILLLAWLFFRSMNKNTEIDFMLWGTRFLGFIICLFASCALVNINANDIWYFSSGGLIGDVLTSLTLPTFNSLGSIIVFIFLWGAGFTLLTGISWLTVVEWVGSNTINGITWVVNGFRRDQEKEQTFKPNLEAYLSANNTINSDKPERKVTEPFMGEPEEDNRHYNIHIPETRTEKKQLQSKLADVAPLPLYADIDSLNTTIEELERKNLNSNRSCKKQVKHNKEAIEVDLNLNELSLDAEVEPKKRSIVTENLLSLSVIEQIIEPIFSIKERRKKKREETIKTHVMSPLERIESLKEEQLAEPFKKRELDSQEILSNSASDKMMESIDHDITDDNDFSDTFTLADPIVTENLAEEDLDEIVTEEVKEPEDVPIDIINQTITFESETIIGEKDYIEGTSAEVVELTEEAQSLTDQHAVPNDVSFQAMVSEAQAKIAAKQNPFLISQDANLPKPASPMPTLALLYQAEKRSNVIDHEALENTARLVESKLADYKIKAEVVGIYPGPVITRFELDLAAGVKVSRISSLSMDLARSLSAMAVRVVEVIPGKPYAALELPNMTRQTVYFSDVIGSRQFEESESATTIVLGQDIAGEAVVADLSKMPHVLVAGTTGSGKSVGVNVMILSMLYKSTPEDVRFIMIDPKMLELSIYEGIPHLLSEVVTDMKDAANALRWCVGEMERRYKLLSVVGVRNLKGFNDKLKMAADAGHPIHDPLWKEGDTMDTEAPKLEKLPSIVVIVDEFADLIMVEGKKVEELIARLAQKARAAGIHLILATQRPSVDVITGLIKANIPSRVAFTVSTKTDSRTILDQGGAESLLGMGDMLYLPSGSSHPIRVHGAFASDDDVHAVVNDWKARGAPNYIDAIISGEQTADNLLPGEKMAGDDDIDQLFDQVVEHVTRTRRGSISGVQRHFRIGYNRAARIIEQLEAQGIVSSPGHNGNREVLAPPPIGD